MDSSLLTLEVNNQLDPIPPNQGRNTKRKKFKLYSILFMQPNTILGIDVGASAIKAALVNIATGSFIGDRYRVETPNPSTPEALALVVEEIAKNFKYKGVIGVGFPSVVKKGVAATATNLDKQWIGTSIEDVFSKATGCQVFAANDADVAGVAEMNFGEGRGVKGTVIMVTIGTGLGTAVFLNGQLLPNTELGHIRLDTGMDAETYASNAAQKRDDLPIRKWAKRFNKYLELMELYFQPDLFILGGGTSKNFEEFKDKITIATKVVPAKLYNNAGIVGAAMYAAGKMEEKNK